jgi:MarR family transcriptional regulator, transcriptional regulator for hemolysin
VSEVSKHFGELFISVSHQWRVQLDTHLRNDERLRPYNLSLAKWRVLLRLHRNPGGLSQRQLAEQVGVEGPTMVGRIDRMEADGLIERRACPNDRRSNIVHLLPTGLSLTPIIEEYAEKVRNAGLQGISEQDLQQCFATLVHIRDTLAALDQQK